MIRKPTPPAALPRDTAHTLAAVSLIGPRERSLGRPRSVYATCHRRLITAIKRMASSAALYIENPTLKSPPAGTFSTSTGRGA